MNENQNLVTRRNSIIVFNNSFYQFYINNKEKNQSELKFKSNEIDTRKYNIITFLPKALFYQFNRPANVYFLISAILQCIPMISPLGPTSAIVPLVIVLSASLIREGIEDCHRAKLDKQQNEEKCDIYNPITNKWEETQSGKLYVGDMISVLENETFPADLILIDSNLPEGICYIETGTLDGEKTLKLKESAKQTGGWLNLNGEKRKEFKLSGVVFADKPNPELYQLNGRMHLKFTNDINNHKNKLLVIDIPLDSKQLLLKGAKLKNTEWAVGIVAYSGLNCKIMKNSKDPVTKYSSLERLMNTSLIFIFIFQGILCLLAAILRGYFYKKNHLDKANTPNISFGYNKYSYEIESFFNYFTYVLLLNTMIPISLIITIEVVKLFQGLFMSYDQYCYSKIRKKFLAPNSVSLNEECGLVNYIFSDKTGTLTCNKMQFKYCVIGETCYQFIRDKEELNDEKGNKFRKEENIVPFFKYEMFDNFTKTETNLNFNKKSHTKYEIKSNYNPNIKLILDSDELIVEQFWYALALCHTCSIQLDEQGKEEYACISPDSIELVRAAKEQGWKLIESGTTSIKRIHLGYFSETFIDFERLELIEFSSDRKRESIIVKEKSYDNEENNNKKIIKLYCKGADSIIEERLSKNSPKTTLRQCKYYVNKFSALGFRTLFIAMKILSQQEYDEFSIALKEAQMSLENKDQKVSEVYDSIERDLFLLGSTIVEDKLQDLVPETIRDLRLAKIKVWMLTGDKMNTAYNIGLSCNLISTKMKTFNVCGKEKKKNENLEDLNQEERNEVILNFAKEYHGFKNQFNSMEKPSFGILVDEKALFTISESEDIQNIFLEIAKDAEAVICCRVSPLQKSQVVKMMKNYDQKGVTLAIGDGGNDVPMIMEAHIGVGIYGEEGLRAVQSSDYAIGEFRFLRELLFSHGRVNYVRISECIHYFFYKNFVLTFNHFIYGLFCNFTGQTIVDDWFITLYNMLFTSLPLGVKAILDIDITRDDGDVVYKMLPFIYKENRDNPIFTIPNFILNLFKGLVFSVINCLIVIFSITNTHINKNGKFPGLWFMSVDIYTNILIIVSITLLVTTKFHTWINFSILGVVTFLAYILFIILVHHWDFFYSVGTMSVAFSSPVLWLDIFIVCGTCGLIEYFILCFYFVFMPNTVCLLKRILAERGKIDTKENLPKSIIDKINIYDNIDEKAEDKIINKKEEIKIENVLEEEVKIEDNSINIDENEKSNGKKDNKAEDEMSQAVFIKRNSSSRKTSNGVGIDILNLSLKNRKLNDSEYFGENLSNSFSEQMSKEKNLYFHNENYFLEQWDFRHKIIKRKKNFGVNQT